MPEHGHPGAAQPGEVDRAVGVVVAVGRQGLADEGRNPPAAGAVVARRDHHGPGIARACLWSGSDHDRNDALGRVPDVGDDAIALDRKAERRPVPIEVAGPGLAWNAVERRPGGRAVMGRVPGLHGQGEAAELHAVQAFGGSQLFHAREGVPHPFPPGRRAVQHQDVVHAIPPQRGRDGEPRLPRAHHDRGVDRCAVRHRGRGHPGARRVAQRREIRAGLDGEGLCGGSRGGGCGHATRSVCAREG